MPNPHSLRRYLPVSARLVADHTRKNLVVVRCGDAPNFGAWFQPDRKRSWDLFLSYYRTPGELPAGTDYVSTGGLSKFSAAHDIYCDHPDLFMRYDYVAFLDDDLDFTFDHIDLMFRVMKRLRLELAQPSLTQDSSVSSHAFKQVAGVGVRVTNFVEVMMPFFSKAALTQCLHTFNKSISTWGLDQVWPRLIRTDPINLAIVDAIEVGHRKPLDTQNGAFYKFLQRLDIDPHAEGQSVWDLYNFIPEEHRTSKRYTLVELLEQLD